MSSLHCVCGHHLAEHVGWKGPCYACGCRVPVRGGTPRPVFTDDYDTADVDAKLLADHPSGFQPPRRSGSIAVLLGPEGADAWYDELERGT